MHKILIFAAGVGVTRTLAAYGVNAEGGEGSFLFLSSSGFVAFGVL